ncbi:MAG: amidohydrolase family protein [Candidatus Muiribacteriota bacterium]
MDIKKILFFVVLGLMLILSLVPSETVQVAIFTGEDFLVIKGDIADSYEVIKEAAVVIQGKEIIWTGPQTHMRAENTRLINTDDYIYPGFIDTHNHPSYNFLPKWRPEKVFTNRYEWARTSDYRELTKPRRKFTSNGSRVHLLDKYAEVKSLIAGTTMIQGAFKRRAISGLIRNVDHYNLATDDHIQTSVHPMQPRELKRADDILANFGEGSTKFHIVHLGEGTCEDSRQELYELDKVGLVREGLVVVHGMAFWVDEFKLMADRGVSLSWSPKSNYVLYETTTRVDVADRHGVKIALSPDWSITGSDNLIYEFQFAWEMNEKFFDNYFTYKDIFDMITLNAAEIVGFDEYIGAVQPGLEADITLIEKINSDPYENLMHIDLEHVNLVMVQGEPFYGEKKHLEYSGKENIEILDVNGHAKALDIVENDGDIPGSDETFRELSAKIKKVYPEPLPLAPGVSLKE